MELRDYQAELIDNIRAELRRGHRRVLAVLPTGGGKTVIGSFLAREVAGRGEAIWFLCHRGFLIMQTAHTFDENDLDYETIVASKRRIVDKPVMIAAIDTLKNRLKTLDPPRVMVWDEAHHCVARGWSMIREWAGPDCLHIGLTATPERLDGKGLDSAFDVMVLGPSVAELMRLGRLSQYRAFAPSAPDTSKLHTVAGEYNAREVEELMRSSMIMGDAVSTYLARARGKRMIYFCPSVAYSQDLVDQFFVAGVRAAHMDAETPEKERIALACMFADGELDVLCNVAITTEGYDLAAQAQRDNVTIEGVGLLRPTASLALHMQMIGRALRPKTEPALILDHAGNILKHGLPDSEISWSLVGREKEKGEALVKLCQCCGAAVAMACRECPECGYQFVAEARSGPIRIDGELRELSEEDKRRMRAQRMNEEARCQTYEDFKALGKARGYKPFWARKRWEETQARIEAQAQAYLRENAA